MIWTHNDTEDIFVGIRSATGNVPLCLCSDFLWLHSLPKVERVIPSCFWTVIIISPSLPEVLYLADMFLAVLVAIFFTMLKVVLWDPYKEKKKTSKIDWLAGICSLHLNCTGSASDFDKENHFMLYSPLSATVLVAFWVIAEHVDGYSVLHCYIALRL